MKTKARRTFYVTSYMKKQLIEKLSLTSSREFDKIIGPHKEKLGQRLGYYYTPKQVRIIFNLVQDYKRNQKG